MKSLQKPLGLNMDFGDVPARFIQKDPAEVEAIAN